MHPRLPARLIAAKAKPGSTAITPQKQLASGQSRLLKKEKANEKI
jgi:hypothetical protein